MASRAASGSRGLTSWMVNPAFGSLYLLLHAALPERSPGNAPLPPAADMVDRRPDRLGSIVLPITGDKLDVDAYKGVDNPVGILPSWIGAPIIVLYAVVLVLSIVSIVVRFRRASGPRAPAAELVRARRDPDRTSSSSPRSRSTRSGRTSATGSSRSAPAARSRCPSLAGIAMVRHRLYDVDFVLNRTLVYGALSACIVGAYAALVFGVGAIGSSQGRLVSAAAAAVCALAAAPLRNRLQRGVNRFLYGARDEPASAVAELGHRLEATLGPDAVLPDARRRRVARAAAPVRGRRARDADRVRARSARRNATRDAARDPARGPGRDRRPPHAVAAQGRRGALARRPARARAARAPGRPRGAGRAAARRSAALARAAGHRARGGAPPPAPRPARRARPVARGDRDAARRWPTRSSGDGAARSSTRPSRPQASQALADIRRLVYDLRPPALDELGLVSALREQGRRFGSLSVTIDADERFDDLPAAVEVAIYRIASEAITNAARHGDAKSCEVRLSVDDALDLDVRDDGKGLPPTLRAGVGLTSMRERATELGGTCTIASVAGGGTRVHARLPVHEEAQWIPSAS